MHATLRTLDRLTNGTHHHAFTTIAQWRGRTYCAYRQAPSHNIVPKGNIMVRTRETAYDPWRKICVRLTHPVGDLRDPRFLVTDDALYLLCGIYLPHPAFGDTLFSISSDNILQTHLAYTTDGDTWSALLPVLRPNYWGWSGVSMGDRWAVASYHTGLTGEGSSLVLWLGYHLLAPLVPTCIYDGGALEADTSAYRYPSTTPSEPVLWYDPATELLGCAVRTGEGLLHLGAGKYPYQTPDWRWHTSDVRMHPSAVLQTAHGLLLAGREIVVERPPTGRRNRQNLYRTYTTLYSLEGQDVTKVVRLPSKGDTAYAGLARGDEEGTVLVSYYSQHEVPQGLPGAAVYVATVEVTA